MTYYQPQQAPKTSRWKTWQKVVFGVTMLLISVICLGCGLGRALTGNQDATATPSAVHLIEPPTSSTSAAGQKVAEPIKTTTPAPKPEQVFTEGTYEVGGKSSVEDGTIKPGTFVLITPDHCYWERVKNFDGDFDSIIANGNLDAPDGKAAQGRITIKKTDKGITLEGDCALGQRGGLK